MAKDELRAGGGRFLLGRTKRWQQPTIMSPFCFVYCCLAVCARFFYLSSYLSPHTSHRKFHFMPARQQQNENIRIAQSKNCKWGKPKNSINNTMERQSIAMVSYFAVSISLHNILCSLNVERRAGCIASTRSLLCFEHQTLSQSFAQCQSEIRNSWSTAWIRKYWAREVTIDGTHSNSLRSWLLWISVLFIGFCFSRFFFFFFFTHE